MLLILTEAGLPVNPRDYALPGNQDPATPWPGPLVLLSAVVTWLLSHAASYVNGAVIPVDGSATGADVGPCRSTCGSTSAGYDGS